MRTYSELIEAMTIQQRLKRSISSKKVARKAAMKRKLSMKKPPSQEKIAKAIDRQVRQKALSIADKSHVCKTAEAGVKANIEKKASKTFTLLKTPQLPGRFSNTNLKEIIINLSNHPISILCTSIQGSTII